MALRPAAPHEILLPVKAGFMGVTLAAALILNFLPWYGTALWIKPDFLALTLLYWCIHQPRRLGFAAAWLLGLAMDIGNASLFGQHALAYTLLAYAGITLHRRVLRFGIGAQVLHVLPLLLASQVAVLLVRMVAGAEFPGLVYFAASVTAAALWPPLTVLFQLPQRPRLDPEQPAI
jgi:rod shape-determining protein MreD